MRRLLALVLVVGIGLAACTGVGAKGGMDVSARFTDVGDLAPGAPVMLADITVGEVKSISLDHNQALVTMSLEPSAHVPQDVVAEVVRTSLLGERVISLSVPESPSNPPLLRDGQTIARTVSKPDLEDLVRQGTAVLGPITASEISTLVHEGYKGFVGEGSNLKAMLQNFEAIVHAYAGRSKQINSVIDSLGQFNATLAGHAQAQAHSMANSARALGVLRDESDHLITAVKALVRLAIGSRAILDQHAAQMGRFFAQMRVILGVLRSEQASIAGTLQWVPLHDRNTQLVDFQQFNQVLQDFVICGMNDSPSDPARRCYGQSGGGGAPSPPSPGGH
jgi:phospholipid/cholesterol/gamma-HCH transport system substrate-binding protein